MSLKKCSGKIFEDEIENDLIENNCFSAFGSNKNIFDYNLVGNFIDFYISEHENVLIKNFPYKTEFEVGKTEFYIKLGKIKGRVECKFQKGNGTAYKKFDYDLNTFPLEEDTHYFLIYGGDFFRKKPNVIKRIKKKYKSKKIKILTKTQFINFIKKSIL